jgi:hypothetical protein
MEAQCRIAIMQNNERMIELSLKCEKFERLPVDRRFLASLPVREIFQAASILEKDPFQVFDHINSVWRPGFLEKVFMKEYSWMFNDNADSVLKRAIEKMNENIVKQVSEIQLKYVELLEHEKTKRNELQLSMDCEEHDYTVLIEEI